MTNCMGKYDFTEEDMDQSFEFREVRREEAEETDNIEQTCFPPNEACPSDQMILRTEISPEVFLVAIDKKTGKMAGLLNGIATDEEVFRDEFFQDARLHKPDGKNIMLLGLDVLPEYRGQGLAKGLMFRYLKKEAARGRKRVILTCLENKVEMYKKMGYRDLGMANSTWGGEKWHEMDYVLEEI